MSKSAIYTTNTAVTTTALTAGSIIPLGVTTRRFGQNLRQDGNTITLLGQGYYLVNVSATVTPSAAGTVSVTAQKDGVAVVGATASETVAAVDTTVNLSITAILRNACGCDSSILSLILGGVDAVINNVAVTVVKL